MLAPAALDALRAAVGDTAVVTDPDLRVPHEVDWTGRWHGDAGAVVRPSSTEAVLRLVRAARAHGLALVPQGGNTGLAAGAVPEGGAVVVDLRGLDHLDDVDVPAAQVTVGAGATLAAVQAHVAPHRLAFGVDLGARSAATIGGMVATNAGGLHVVRYGPMRSQVLGLEAVLGTGEVVAANLAGLLKDNTGYDLAGLLCGSEGTLGIITGVRLRLVPVPAERLVLLLGLPSLTEAVAALPRLRALPTLHAVELMRAGDLRRVEEHLAAPFPLQPVPPGVLLVELAGTDPAADGARLVAGLEASDEATAVAEDERGRAGLWRWREAHPEAAAALGLVHKADVTIPTARVVAFAEQVDGAIASVAPDATTFVYGHLADGNLHVNVVGPDAEDDRPVDAVLDLALRHGGSVSAEHGIGRAKRRWLARQRGDAAVAAMRALKSALDPDGVLNPDVLLP
jgi:FAD/FMN-containing dehydrogenase